jgi:hypothetical protein
MNPTPIPAFDAARLQDYRLSLALGHAESLHGRTELELGGDGRFQARQIGGRKREAMAAHGELAREPLVQLLRAALQFDWNRAFPPRPGIPDEPIVEWSLALPGGSTLAMRAWLRDVERGDLSGPALEQLRRALAEASHGQLFL